MGTAPSERVETVEDPYKVSESLWPGPGPGDVESVTVSGITEVRHADPEEGTLTPDRHNDENPHPTTGSPTLTSLDLPSLLQVLAMLRLC